MPASATRVDLCRMIDELPDDNLSAARARRTACHNRLLGSGLAGSIPCPSTPGKISRFSEWKPIRIDGEPVLQTLIRERR